MEVRTMNSITLDDELIAALNQLVKLSGEDESIISELVEVSNGFEEVEAAWLADILKEAVEKAEIRIAILSEQAKIGAPDSAKVGSAVAEIQNKISELSEAIICPSPDRLPFFSINLPFVSDSFTEYSSKFAARSAALDLMRGAYDHREKAVRKCAERVLREIKRVKGYEPVDGNFYFDMEKKVSSVLAECCDILKQAGVILSEENAAPIKIERNNDDFDETEIYYNLIDYVAYSKSPYTINNYFSDYCELIKDDTNGLFNVTYRYFGVCNAVREMEKDLREKFKDNLAYEWAKALRNVGSYCEKMRAELDARANRMLTEAEENVKLAQGDINAEIEELRSAVNSVKEYVN